MIGLRRLVPDRASRGGAKRRAIASTTLKALRQAQDKLRVLSVDGEVARSGLGRFAAFGPPTRIFSENA